jgi:Spy/CpxP family protein refolding chaperone
MTARHGPIRRTRLLASVVLVATFAAGALVGVASEQVLDADEPGRAGERHVRRTERDLFGPDGTLTRRLELTEPQRTEIERMLTAERAKTDSILRQMRPRLRARYDSTTARIRGVLTVEQQAEFDRYREERRERMRRTYRNNDDRRQDEGR